MGLAAVWLAGVRPCSAALFDFDVDPFYAESVMKGRFGDTPVYFFLGPSPSMEKAVLAFIQSADKTLDVCLYDLDLPEVAQALLDAKERGVKVRVIIADENAEKAYAISGLLKEMEKKKMLTLAHNRSGLMHNKFMVADGEHLWTGSCNITRTGTRFNDNHVIVLESKELAENYTKEWEEIADKRHGKRFAWPTPHPQVDIGGTRIQNLFTPEDDVRGALVAEMNKATNEIAIMAFSFTEGDITQACRDALARDVRVVIVLDSGMATHPSSKTKELQDMGAAVRLSPGVLSASQGHGDGPENRRARLRQLLQRRLRQERRECLDRGCAAFRPGHAARSHALLARRALFHHQVAHPPAVRHAKFTMKGPERQGRLAEATGLFRIAPDPLALSTSTLRPQDRGHPCRPCPAGRTEPPERTFRSCPDRA